MRVLMAILCTLIAAPSFAASRPAEPNISKAVLVLVQLNEGHRYTLDREGLIKMLDEGLATAKPRTK